MRYMRKYQTNVRSFLTTVMLAVMLGSILILANGVHAEEYTVSTEEELEQRISRAQPGDVFIIAPGHYAVSLRLQQAGTAEEPITLKGTGNVILTPKSGSALEVNAPFWNVEQISIDGQGKDRILVNIKAQGFSLQQSKLMNTLSSAIEVKASNVTLAKNDIFAIDKLEAWFFAPGIYILLTGLLLLATLLSLSFLSSMHSQPSTVTKLMIVVIVLNLLFLGWLFIQGGLFFQNKDAHAVFIWPGSRDVDVRENNMYQLSGDGIQVINDFKETGLPAAQGVIIADNHIRAARENCIDIKTSQSVLIEGNTCSGVLPSKTSWGEGIIIHSNAYNITLKNNILHHTRNGITVTRGAVTDNPEEYPRQVIMSNNTITQFLVPDNGFGSGSGILIGQSDHVRIENNKVSGAHDFAFGLTNQGKSKTIVLKDNTLTGTIALHLSENYKERMQEASGNSLQGKVRMGRIIKDSIQDIQDPSFNAVLGVTSSEVPIGREATTEGETTNNNDLYAHRTKEEWLFWSQSAWLGMVALIALALMIIIANHTAYNTITQHTKKKKEK